MPDVYISRAGMENGELGKKFAITEISILNDTLAKIKLDGKIKDEWLETLERKMAVLEEKFLAMVEMYQKRPKVAEAEAAIQRKSGRKSAITNPKLN